MCLPCKEEEDSQMSTITADLYGRVLRTMTLAAIDKEAPYLYVDAVNVQRGVMEIMFENKLLDHGQVDRLKTYLQKFCYRADKLIAWARKPEAEIVTHAAGWTEQLFVWAKEDQDFFTALINEIADWYKYAKQE